MSDDEKKASGAIWFPWQRAIRTGLQVLAGIIIATAGALATFALVAPQLLEAVRDTLNPDVYALLVTWVATATAVSVALSRIMAIPQVDAFLKKWGAGSAPASVEVAPEIPVDPNMTREEYRSRLEHGGGSTGNSVD